MDADDKKGDMGPYGGPSGSFRVEGEILSFGVGGDFVVRG